MSSARINTTCGDDVFFLYEEPLSPDVDEDETADDEEDASSEEATDDDDEDEDFLEEEENGHEKLDVMDDQLSSPYLLTVNRPKQATITTPYRIDLTVFVLSSPVAANHLFNRRLSVGSASSLYS